MAYLSFPNVRVVGISACVPKEIDDNQTNSLINDDERDNLIQSIGIIQKRKAPDGVTSSDLCYESAEKLIAEIGWNRKRLMLWFLFLKRQIIYFPLQHVFYKIALLSPKSVWLLMCHLDALVGYMECRLFHLCCQMEASKRQYFW